MNSTDNDLFDSAVFYIMITAIILSTSTSIFLIFILKDKIYKQSKLMMKVAIGETISIFSSIWFMFRYDVRFGFAKVFRYSQLYAYLYDFDIAKIAMDKVNMSLFYSFQTYTILLSSFLCLEIYFSLNNPIAKINKRYNIYLIVTYIITAFQFIVLMVNTTFATSKVDEFITEAMFHENFGIVFRIVNLVCFFFFCSVGIVSIIYLMQRFCKKTNMKLNLAREQRYKFVTKHCVFVIIYCLFFLPLMINEFIFTLYNDKTKLFFVDVSLVYNL